MINFEYYTPTKIAFGRGVESRTGELARAFGAHKALIHYGGKSALASGLIGRIKASLDAAGMAHVEHFAGVELAVAVRVNRSAVVPGEAVVPNSRERAQRQQQRKHN